MADGVIVSLLVSLIVAGFAERRNAWRSQRRYSHLRSRLEGTLALYELRTYTLCVGKMPEAVRLYQELGFPALQRGGHEKKLIGYFQGDTGMDRRAHWATAFANTDFSMGFASKFQPLVTQEVKLLQATQWGPHP